jgi:hypothetical protein
MKLFLKVLLSRVMQPKHWYPLHSQSPKSEVLSAIIIVPNSALLSSNGGICDRDSSVVADYIDCEESEYSAGVAAFVKIELKNGIHHQDVGYGICNGSCSKGYAIAHARKVSVFLQHCYLLSLHRILWWKCWCQMANIIQKLCISL